MKRNAWRDLELIGLLSVGLLTTYLLSGNHVPIDSKWSLYTAMSIWREGNAKLSNYYRLYQQFSFSTLGEALVGQWVSPSRGLLVFSPVLIFSLVGVALKIRQHRLEWLDRFLIAIIVLQWLTISVWPVRWGGWTFGPHMFSDMLPYFIYFMIPVLVALSTWPQAQRTVTLAIGLTLYNLATGERLPVIVNGHAVDSRLVLTGETPR